MTLFLVGVIEMAIAASWTRVVTKSNVLLTGAITYANIFVWYYVLDQVVNHIHGWIAVVPYAAGCALGSMLGGMEPKTLLRRIRRLQRTFRTALRGTGLTPPTRSKAKIGKRVRASARFRIAAQP